MHPFFESGQGKGAGGEGENRLRQGFRRRLAMARQVGATNWRDESARQLGNRWKNVFFVFLGLLRGQFPALIRPVQFALRKAQSYRKPTASHLQPTATDGAKLHQIAPNCTKLH
jgi:hypothetical protein